MRRSSINRTQLETLKNLYYGEERSVREVADHLSVGMSAVYRFMRKHELKRRDQRTSNQLRFDKKPLSYTLRVKFSEEDEKLRMAGVLLYWAEGAKRNKSIDFANSEVEMCKIFIRFLRHICRVDEKRLRGYLYCHDNQNPKELIRFWSKTLELPEKQFTQPYVRKYKHDGHLINRRPKRMQYGLVHIRYSDVKLLQQINCWIEEYKKWAGS